MKDIITKVLTTATASLGGLGTYLAAKGLIAIGDIGAVNGAGTSLGAALVLILGAMLTHLLMMASAKLFRTGSGEETTRGGSGGLPLWVLIGTLAGCMGFLPACSPEQLAAARAVPIKACVHTDQGDVCYSTKDGISAEINPHFPALRSVPMALSGASRRKQIPCSQSRAASSMAPGWVKPRNEL